MAESILFLLDENEKVAIEKAKDVLDQFADYYLQLHQAQTSKKLGFSEPTEQSLIDDIERWLTNNEVDYTLFWRTLSKQVSSTNGSELLMQLNVQSEEQIEVFNTWFTRWQKALKKSEDFDNAKQLMLQNNPAIIPRNHKIAEAIAAAEDNDFVPFKRLVKALANPYIEKEEFADLMLPAKTYERVSKTFCGT